MVVPNPRVGNPRMGSCGGSASPVLSCCSDALSDVTGCLDFVPPCSSDQVTEPIKNPPLQQSFSMKFVCDGVLSGAELAKVFCMNRSGQMKVLHYLRKLRDKLRWSDAEKAATQYAE